MKPSIVNSLEMLLDDPLRYLLVRVCSASLADVICVLSFVVLLLVIWRVLRTLKRNAEQEIIFDTEEVVVMGLILASLVYVIQDCL